MKVKILRVPDIKLQTYGKKRSPATSKLKRTATTGFIRKNSSHHEMGGVTECWVWLDKLPRPRPLWIGPLQDTIPIPPPPEGKTLPPIPTSPSSHPRFPGQLKIPWPSFNNTLESYCLSTWVLYCCWSICERHAPFSKLFKTTYNFMLEFNLPVFVQINY